MGNTCRTVLGHRPTYSFTQGREGRNDGDKMAFLNRPCLPILLSSASLNSSPLATPRKTKGQQLKGKIGSALFRTFWQFSTHFHTFSEFFRIFPPGLFLRIKGFYCCFSSKIRKDNKREKKIKRKRPNHFAR